MLWPVFKEEKRRENGLAMERTWIYREKNTSGELAALVVVTDEE
jgi:hypothetical protein